MQMEAACQPPGLATPRLAASVAVDASPDDGRMLGRLKRYLIGRLRAQQRRLLELVAGAATMDELLPELTRLHTSIRCLTADVHKVEEATSRLSHRQPPSLQPERRAAPLGKSAPQTPPTPSPDSPALRLSRGPSQATKRAASNRRACRDPLTPRVLDLGACSSLGALTASPALPRLPGSPDEGLGVNPNTAASVRTADVSCAAEEPADLADSKLYEPAEEPTLAMAGLVSPPPRHRLHSRLNAPDSPSVRTADVSCVEGPAHLADFELYEPAERPARPTARLASPPLRLHSRLDATPRTADVSCAEGPADLADFELYEPAERSPRPTASLASPPPRFHSRLDATPRTADVSCAEGPADLADFELCEPAERPPRPTARLASPPFRLHSRLDAPDSVARVRTADVSYAEGPADLPDFELCEPAERPPRPTARLASPPPRLHSRLDAPDSVASVRTADVSCAEEPADLADFELCELAERPLRPTARLASPPPRLHSRLDAPDSVASVRTADVSCAERPADLADFEPCEPAEWVGPSSPPSTGLNRLFNKVFPAGISAISDSALHGATGRPPVGMFTAGDLFVGLDAPSPLSPTAETPRAAAASALRTAAAAARAASPASSGSRPTRSVGSKCVPDAWGSPPVRKDEAHVAGRTVAASVLVPPRATVVVGTPPVSAGRGLAPVVPVRNLKLSSVNGPGGKASPPVRNAPPPNHFNLDRSYNLALSKVAKLMVPATQAH